MRKKFIVLAVSFFLMILYLTKVYGDSTKRYKLSLIGEKNWSEVTQLNLPKKEKKELLYKSNVLYAAHNRNQPDHVVAFSSNGKFKVEMRRTDDPLDENLGVATIYDSLGKKLWKGTVGFWVFLSNNGNDFVSVGSEASVIRFHKISDTTIALDKGMPYVYADRYGFTYDGKYFVGAGSSLDLYTADGNIIWRKNTNSGSTCELAFSEDAGVIALAISPWIANSREPEISNITDTLKTQSLDPSVKNTYIFILNRKGEVLHKEILDWPVIHHMTFSPKGNFLALSWGGGLLLIDVNTKKHIGTYVVPPSNLSMAFSPAEDLLAVLSYGTLCLLNLKGQIIDSTKLSDNLDTDLVGPTLAFSDSGKILLASSKNKLYAFKIEER